MGNLLLTTGIFRTDSAIPVTDKNEGTFATRRIRSSIIYYYATSPEAGVKNARDTQKSPTLCPGSPLDVASSSDPSSPPLLSDSPSHTPVSSHSQSHSDSTSRPLLLFFSWLGAQQGAVAKYRDIYLQRGMDVLLVQSSVMHFLWPRWGLEYGSEVLKVLEEPQFLDRPVLVHSASIGGYTFTQILTHISQEPEKHAGLAQRVIGHIYDSLVVGTLEHMAIGLGKTLVPRFESLVKNAAMFYFWLFKTHTADFYNSSIHVFHNSPITTPALFFFSENDALCSPAAMENCMDLWRKRGMTVESRKWKVSTHAAHMRCHPEDYLSTLQKYLNSLKPLTIKAKM
ncbi:transmembrane protein 53-like [Halichoeres trimaculatus]|uniref:transmembrane protein 53-like n=1 Tax=Halichoeres trimaculatus TaxID=147232 RepID=UPI003D9DECDA